MPRMKTLPSGERVRDYARDYQVRSERSRAMGVSYSQARVLRATYKLSDTAKARIARTYGRSGVTEIHTKYAITRAHIARAQLARGETATKRNRRAANAIRELPPMRNPVLALGNFYQAIGMDPGTLPTSSTPLPPRATGFGGGGGFEGSDFGGGGDIDHYSEGGYGGSEEEAPLAPRELSGYEDFSYYEEDVYDWYDDMVEDFEMYDYGEYNG